MHFFWGVVVHRIDIRTLGPLARIGDHLMEPIMRLVSGAPYEEPQRTHWWNNRDLTEDEAQGIDLDICVRHSGIPGAVPFRDWRFHMPVMGGWRDYIVISPYCASVRREGWYAGWILEDGAGVSLLRLSGSMVRLLLGPKPVAFFALTLRGTQTAVTEEGRGRTGEGGRFSFALLI